MSSEVKRFNPDALGDMRENLAGEYVSATDYDTVSAELREFKNGNTMSLLRAGFAKACEERDAALAQLAAIQGGMGEEVEVVAWRHFGDASRLLCDLGKQRSVPGDYAAEFNIPLMTVAQHQRITAAMAAEVERLSRMLNNATNDGIKLADERDARRAELAEVNGREPALWFRSLIGAQCRTDGRCYDVVFSPCEGFIPLYALPPAKADEVSVPRDLFTQTIGWIEDRMRYGEEGTLHQVWRDLKTIQAALLAIGKEES